MSNRNDYQREYMRKRRAALPPSSHKGRMAQALRTIIAKLGDNEKSLAVELRKIASDALEDK